MRALIQEIHAQIKILTGIELSAQDWAPTPNKELGDVAVPCFKLSKALGKAPPVIAQELAKSWPTSGPHSLIARVVATGPYLNVFADPEAVFAWLRTMWQKDPTRFGGSDLGTGKTLIVEFSSPNIAKEMALHHLRSTGIGHALSNISALHGFSTVRINYLGDWGTSHGKNILGLKLYGNEAELVEKGLPYLLDIYVRFNRAEKEDPSLSDQAKAAFAKLEEGDPESLRVWKLFRDISIREYKKLYHRLGVHFDVFDGESMYFDKLDPVEKEINEKIGTRVSDGALVYDLPGHSVPVLLRKDDGASLYISRDLAAIQDRWNRYAFEQTWYVVDVRQALHFKQLTDTVKALEKPYAGRAEHVPFGMLLFGTKVMKTRDGNILFLTDVLDEAKRRAAEIIREKNPALANADEVAEMVGKGAVMFADLSQHRTHDVKFDWEKALSFEGDTSPFVQYAHARCGSLIRKGEEHLRTLPPSEDPAGVSALMQELPVRMLLSEIFSFYTSAERALADRDPSQIATTCLNIAKGMNHFYHKVRFLDESSAPRLRALLDLTSFTRDVLKHGLGLLGIPAPKEM